MNTILKLAVVVASVAGLAACEGTPRERNMQWVARDAWDSSCAEKAMVETWAATNPRWKVPNEVYVVDVDAKFRLTDNCTSGLPLVGKSYKTLEVVPFKGTVEMSKCKKDGQTGWALPGKESSRCWTGPTLLGATK
jgi:hypothetical protein